MFSEQWLTQFNYADAHNRRIMGENLIDKILGTDHTMTVPKISYQGKHNSCLQHVGLTDYEFIIFDTLTNEVQSAFI